MTRYLARRIVQSFILLFVVSILVFAIVHSAPGGPAILFNPEIDPREAQKAMAEMGLTDPIPVQYGRWIANVLRGNFGRSYQHGVPTARLVLERVPNTLLLAGTALALATLAAIPLGIMSAVRRYSAVDYAATITAFLGVSIPVFWLGILFIIIFSVHLGWLPSAGMVTAGEPFRYSDLLRHLIMPAAVLSTFPMAQLARYTRSSMVEVVAQDYIRTARAKGLAETAVLARHALKNALIPVVTVLGVLIPRLLGGAVITESIFAWPGLGRLAVDSAITRDYPVIMAITMFVAALVILGNLAADLAYVTLDPRIELQ